MNIFPSSSSSIKRFSLSSFLFRFGLILLLLMIIITTIALKGLFEPNLLNPNIINPSAPHQILTPSPLPAPQITTPTPDHLSHFSFPSNHFPLLIFVAIFVSSAIVSLFVTAWLKYLSLPSKQKQIVNKYLSLILKKILFPILWMRLFIIDSFQTISSFLKPLAQKLQQKKPKIKKKTKIKTTPKTVNNWPQNYQNQGHQLTNLTDNYNQPFNGFMLSYQDQSDQYLENNYPLEKFNQNQPIKPKKKPQSPHPKSKKLQPKNKKTKTTYLPNKNHNYDQPEVIILTPDEQTPLDQKPPTLAQLMDLRRHQSLSSLFDKRY